MGVCCVCACVQVRVWPLFMHRPSATCETAGRTRPPADAQCAMRAHAHTHHACMWCIMRQHCGPACTLRMWRARCARAQNRGVAVLAPTHTHTPLCCGAPLRPVILTVQPWTSTLPSLSMVPCASGGAAIRVPGANETLLPALPDLAPARRRAVHRPGAREEFLEFRRR